MTRVACNQLRQLIFFYKSNRNWAKFHETRQMFTYLDQSAYIEICRNADTTDADLAHAIDVLLLVRVFTCSAAAAMCYRVFQQAYDCFT